MDRALSILQTIARTDRDGAGVTEIAEALGVHTSTVFRLLATLEARGFVEQSIKRGKYRLGQSLTRLITSAQPTQDLVTMCHPVLVELAERLGESSNLSLRDGDLVVTVDQVLGRAAISSVNWVGQRSLMHTTSAGKLYLSELEEPELEDLLRDPLKARTDRSIVDRQDLARELAVIRAQRYGASFEEDTEGLVAVGAPIRGAAGGIIGVLGISGPSFRLDRDTAPAIAAQIIKAADRLSFRNGFTQPE